MKKYTKIVSLVFVLFIGVFMFAGCGNTQKQHNVSFMTPYNITYTESAGVNCSYAVEGGADKTINDKEVIGAVSINTQYGADNLYKFVGWFTEEECLNQWDLYRDEVRCDLILYAKYVRA
jgi:hypothetical protein